ncbi:hypothetical protein [Mangrovivirga cuniculi]|uniref:Uncharacterized protein n=1 Tax=Mangrovivirga cuniculi TaxID=2715131 RepID=A0A4D7K0V7_9BACT|nr:hypothetical protein [Mangrovivirga cuniculi]QCK16555.1 hypothetical protein DCC35_18385 [Mangrovivirga cuniculi]
MLKVGLVILAIILIVALIKYFMTKSEFYSRVLKRALIWGALGLTTLLIQPEKWLEIKYSDHPDYVSAVKNLREHPDDPEALEKLKEEQRKLN